MALTKVSYSMINARFANVLDYGADPTATNDSSAAIQAAVNANDCVFIPEGSYRCDNPILIESTYQHKKYVLMTGSTKLQRLSAHSASQGPVIEAVGNYGHFDGAFGEIMSENISPRGVVVLGQRDTNTLSTGNGLYWSFVNCDIRCKDTAGAEPAVGTVVGVYIPSAQPYKGSNYANYFGTVSNVRVYSAGTAFWLTDICNAHTFVNCTIDAFWHYGWLLNAAYGNTIYGGFINGCQKDYGTAIRLDNKLAPSAPYAASHQSNNNNIYGMTMELYTANNYGVYIPAGVGGYSSAHNWIQFSWNSSGTSVTDLTNDGTNTINDGSTIFQIGENIQIPDNTLSGYNLLQVGTKSYLSNHAIAKTVAPGGVPLVVENLNTTAAVAGGLQVAWNTPTIGYAGAIISTYHKPTTTIRFKVIDNGDCQNTNGVYAAISDAKLKDIVGLSGSQWEDVKLLASKLTKYTLKSDPTKQVQLGWIAQDIEQDCPGLVYETPDVKVVEKTNKQGEVSYEHELTGETTKGVRYSIATLKAFKALGEAMERIEVLEAKIVALTHQ